MSPDEDFLAFRSESAIREGEPAFAEIEALFAAHDLDIACWRFTPQSASHYARSLPEGGHENLPVVEIGFRRTRDFETQSIDPHAGNSDNGWALTDRLRSGLNSILRRHRLGSDFVSDHTLVFPFSWETRAYFRLGHLLKNEVLALIRATLPPVRSSMFRKLEPMPRSIYFGSYWGKDGPAQGQYNLLFDDERAMRHAEPFEAEFRTRAEELFRHADRSRSCTDYRVGWGFWHSKMKNLPPLYRED